MWQIIKQLRILLAPRDKRSLIGIAVLMAVGAMAEIAGIGLILPVVAIFTKPELLEQNRFLQMYAQIVGAGSETRLMILSCLLIIAVYAVKNMLSLFIIFQQGRFVARKEYELCKRQYSIYMHAPYELHLKRGHIELGVMLVRTREFCTRVIMPIMCMLSDITVIITLSAVLFFTMPVISLSTLIMMALNILLIYWILRKLNYNLGAEYNRNIMESEKVSGEGLRAVKAVKIAGKEEFFIERTNLSRKAASWSYMKLFTIGQIPRLWLETIAIVQLMMLFAVMILIKIPHGTILMSFSLLIAAMSRMLPSCSRLNYNFALIRQSLAAAESVLTASAEPAEHLGSGKPVKLQKEITIENLSFSYVPGTPVLSGVSFTIPRLAEVAFTGVTGSGKSTLADLIMGLFKPDSGTIKVDGRDIHENLASWRKCIGYVPQFIFLLDSSIRENVAFGIPEQEIDDEKIWACLRVAQLDKFIDSLPDKLSTSIGDNGIQLSGGQRQRIGIARALYSDPELLVLDEATSALDNETEQAFVDALRELHGKITIITIAHRLSTIAHCDLNINLSKQNITE